MSSLISFIIISICIFLLTILLGLIYMTIKIDCEKICRNITRSDRNIIVDKDGTKHYEGCAENIK